MSKTERPDPKVMRERTERFLNMPAAEADKWYRHQIAMCRYARSIWPGRMWMELVWWWTGREGIEEMREAYRERDRPCS